MPTNAACPKEVAPPTPVSSTRPSATSAPMPMSLSSETVNEPAKAGATASAATTRPSRIARLRPGLIDAPRQRRTAAGPPGGRARLRAAVRSGSLIDLLFFLFGGRHQEGAQHQHRDQQAEHDHVRQRAAPERGEALDQADGER